MIKIGILGDIGSGKSYVAQSFGYPVFDADYEVAKLYKKNKNIFNKLKVRLTKYIYSLSIEKKPLDRNLIYEKACIDVIIDAPKSIIKVILNTLLVILFFSSQPFIFIKVLFHKYFYFYCEISD